jgi:hypothetical protein
MESMSCDHKFIEMITTGPKETQNVKTRIKWRRLEGKLKDILRGYTSLWRWGLQFPHTQLWSVYAWHEALTWAKKYAVTIVYRNLTWWEPNGKPAEQRESSDLAHRKRPGFRSSWQYST